MNPIVDYSKDDYHEKRHAELLSSELLRIAWGEFADFAYFNGVTPGMSVLEFGGGLGANLLSISKRAEAWMVEPAIIGREMATRGGVRTVSTTAELGNRRFDVILCRHVLEHLDQPLSTLEELRSFLKPDARLIVVLPCEPMTASVEDDDINHHLYCWNGQTISNLVRRAGLEVDCVRHQYYAARRRLLPLYIRYGGHAYAVAVQLVGKVLRRRELMIICHSSSSGCHAG